MNKNVLSVLFSTLFALFVVGCASDTPEEEEDPTTAASEGFFQEPSQAPTVEVDMVDYTSTSQAVGTTVYEPPEPPPPVYDPCAIDPVTGNVEDGDCFAGIPVD